MNLGADRYINKNGSPQTVYCELADAINKTMERKKSKQLLVESEIKYRTLVEKSLQGILITKTSPLRLVFANSAMGIILGYSIEDLKSLSPLDVAGLIHDEDKALFFGRLENRMHGEPANSSLEFRAVRKNGSIVWLEAFANPIEYMGERAVQGMFLDITERKKIQEILLESEAKYRELANSLPDIVFETEIDGKLTFINDAALKMGGCSDEDFGKGLNILEFIVPEDKQKAIENIGKLLAGDNHITTEFTFKRKDGTTFPALVTATLRMSANKVVGLRGLAIDITERKNAEEKLKESQEMYETTFESSKDALMLTDEKNFLYCNTATLQLYRCSSVEEFKKYHPADLSPQTQPDGTPSMEASMSHINKALKTGSDSFLWVHKRLDGTTFPADVLLTRMPLKGRKVLQATVRDVTELKKAEALKGQR